MLEAVRDVIDSAGTLLTHIEYDSFGNVVSQTPPPIDFGFGYAGYQQDATGLDYCRARYYDPSTGRFLSQDPLGFAAGDTNLYRYVGNSPLTATDPTGLCSSHTTSLSAPYVSSGITPEMDFSGLLPERPLFYGTWTSGNDDSGSWASYAPAGTMSSGSASYGDWNPDMAAGGITDLGRFSGGGNAAQMGLGAADQIETLRRAVRYMLACEGGDDEQGTSQERAAPSEAGHERHH